MSNTKNQDLTIEEIIEKAENYVKDKEQLSIVKKAYKELCK